MHGDYVRRSLGVRSWEAAQKIVRDWEAKGGGGIVSVKEAVEKYLSECESRGLGSETMRKYRLLGRELKDLYGPRPVGDVGIDDLDAYRKTWQVKGIAARKKIERLRAFFRFCVEREYAEKNPAMLMKHPREIHKPTLPVSDEDFEKLLAACEGFPNPKIRGFLLVLRYAGLRLQDCVKLTRDKVVDGKVFLYTSKTKVPVYVPVPDVVVSELSKIEGERFFWSGLGAIKTTMGNWQRSLERLGKRAGVKFHAHQFRHSLAIALLNSGATLETVAAILGNSVKIAERHYAPFVKSRQVVIEDAVRRAFTL